MTCVYLIQNILIYVHMSVKLCNIYIFFPRALLFYLLEIFTLYIPRHTRQLYHQPIPFLLHLDLTPQPTRLRQSERQIQHVVLVIVRLGEFVIHVLVRDYDVTRRTRARTPTRPFHLEVVMLRYIEDIIPRGNGKGVRFAMPVENGYAESRTLLEDETRMDDGGRGRYSLFACFWRVDVSVSSGTCRCERSTRGYVCLERLKARSGSD